VLGIGTDTTGRPDILRDDQAIHAESETGQAECGKEGRVGMRVVLYDRESVEALLEVFRRRCISYTVDQMESNPGAKESVTIYRVEINLTPSVNT